MAGDAKTSIIFNLKIENCYVIMPKKFIEIKRINIPSTEGELKKIGVCERQYHGTSKHKFTNKSVFAFDPPSY